MKTFILYNNNNNKTTNKQNDYCNGDERLN